MAFALHRGKMRYLNALRKELALYLDSRISILSWMHASRDTPRSEFTFDSIKCAQVTGLTVTDTGRLFANFPRWREGIPFSVLEVAQTRTYHPYPDESWNRWDGHLHRTRSLLTIQKTPLNSNHCTNR